MENSIHFRQFSAFHGVFWLPVVDVGSSGHSREAKARCLDLLTKNQALPKREREREYDDKLENAPETVKIAKLADLYDNLSRRIGTSRLPSTIKNARRLAEKFKPQLTNKRGRTALDHVQRLILEIEETKFGSKPRKTLAPKAPAKRTRTKSVG